MGNEERLIDGLIQLVLEVFLVNAIGAFLGHELKAIVDITGPVGQVLDEFLAREYQVEVGLSVFSIATKALVLVQLAEDKLDVGG